jgi:hypothetical protein
MSLVSVAEPFVARLCSEVHNLDSVHITISITLVGMFVTGRKLMHPVVHSPGIKILVAHPKGHTSFFNPVF